MKHGPNDFSLRAEIFLTDRIARSFPQYRSPTDEWRAIERVHSSNGEGASSTSIGPGEERRLVSIGVLQDVSQLKLKADRIETFIRRRCKGAGQCLPAFVDALALEDLAKLSGLAADISRYAPEPIMLSLQGKIASAMHAVPPQGCGTIGYDRYSRHQIFDVITEIAKYHILIALIRAGEAAYRRCFEPSGMHVLDEHGGRRATTVKNVAQVIAWNAIWMEPLIGLYEKLKTQPLSQQDEDAVRAVPGLVEDAERWERELTKMFGDGTPAFVAECHRVARYWSNFIRRATARKAAAADPNQTIYAAHGTHPLATLWLTCAVAMTWVTADKVGEKTPLDQALLDILADKSVRRPQIPRKVGDETRKLFFLIRNAIAQDPKAPAVIASRQDGDLFAAIEQKFREELSKEEGHMGQEPFSTTITSQANKLYADAVERKDEVLLTEIDGMIWRQLHL